MKQRELWEKIRVFPLDDPQSALSFSDKLARENGWSLIYTARCIQEYKRFMYLICIAEFPLVPSDEVDQVWHLHLLYTESYWTNFCQNTLERQIHHGPTKGGKSEQVKFTDLYEKTLQFYHEIFDETPPDDIWKPTHIRFGEFRFQRINLHRYRTFPKILPYLKEIVSQFIHRRIT